ncbi:MAG: hypothetical protein WC979_07815 [Candidatus Pacearchaeota archaeon]|jgi:hypothetical protein
MKKDIGNVKHFSEEDLRFATPLDVANFRAKGLKCKVIVDLCSGIGIQSGAFAKTSGQVFGFEIDERKVSFAEKNFKGINNLKFETGNVLDEKVIEKIRKIRPDIIFCDPERLPQEKERTLESISPDIFKLLEVYSKITPNICLEIPPQIDIDKLDRLGNMEREYLSVGNKLNRLDLYFGNLKKAEVSVVDVNGERIERRISSFDKSNEDSRFAAKAVKENSKNASIEVKKFNENAKFAKTNKISRYVYEISTAIVKAGLENEFANEIQGKILEGCEKNKVLISSDNLDNKFRSLCKVFEVMGIGNNYIQVMDLLKKFKIGKVVIKYSVDPKDYWTERGKYERQLRGNREAVLFNVCGKYAVCEEI